MADPASSIRSFPSRPRLLVRGLTRRCPWCGDRKAYFVGWFRRRDRCRRCDHPFRRGDEAFELGAVTANIILTFASLLVVILAIAIATAPDVDGVAIVAVGAGVALVGPAVLYPISFTLWQAIDLWMRPPTDEELGRTPA